MKHPAILVPVILGLLGCTASAALYGRLPPSMTVHWDISGEADGFAPRAVAAFALPVLTILLSAMHALVLRFEPRAPHLQRSSKALAAVTIAMALVLTLTHLTVLAAALGMTVSAASVALGAIGILLVVSGNYMGKTRSNFALGIRNRWTLSDETVWDRTHRVAGRVLVAEGLAAMLVSLSGAGGAVVGAGLLAVLAVTLVSLNLYSLSLWRRRRPAAANTH